MQGLSRLMSHCIGGINFVGAWPWAWTVSGQPGVGLVRLARELQAGFDFGARRAQDLHYYFQSLSMQGFEGCV
jgi:hypothetical protein